MRLPNAKDYSQTIKKWAEKRSEIGAVNNFVAVLYLQVREAYEGYNKRVSGTSCEALFFLLRDQIKCLHRW